MDKNPNVTNISHHLYKQGNLCNVKDNWQISKQKIISK